MVRRSLAAAAVALCLAGTGAAARPARAVAAVPHVAVEDFAYAPTTVSVGAGHDVVFDFVGPSHHTVTDATGMALFDSGSAGPGDPSFTVTFPAAGTYLFTCIPHPWMNGRVGVPLRIHRLPGEPGTVRVGWAAAAATGGLVYDVQLARPGRGWTDWRVGVTERNAPFAPRAGDGTYRFRARLRSDDGKTLWSAAARLRVG